MHALIIFIFLIAAVNSFSINRKRNVVNDCVRANGETFDIKSKTRLLHFMANEPSQIVNTNTTSHVVSGNGVVSRFSSTVQNLLLQYSNCLTTRPYVTKIVSSAIVGGLGDLLIQYLNGGNSLLSFNLRRWIVFTSVAGFYIAPSIHLWFDWLAGLPLPASFNGFKVALVQMLLDQTIGAVVINAGFFYAFQLSDSLVPPYPASGALANIFPGFLVAGTKSVQRNMWKTLVANWYCWPGKSSLCPH